MASFAFIVYYVVSTKYITPLGPEEANKVMYTHQSIIRNKPSGGNRKSINKNLHQFAFFKEVNNMYGIEAKPQLKSMS